MRQLGEPSTNTFCRYRNNFRLSQYLPTHIFSSDGNAVHQAISALVWTQIYSSKCIMHIKGTIQHCFDICLHLTVEIAKLMNFNYNYRSVVATKTVTGPKRKQKMYLILTAKNKGLSFNNNRGFSIQSMTFWKNWLLLDKCFGATYALCLQIEIVDIEGRLSLHLHKMAFTTAATPKHNCIVHFSRFGTSKAKSLGKVQFDTIIFAMKGLSHSLNIVKGLPEGVPWFLGSRFYNQLAF